MTRAGRSLRAAAVILIVVTAACSRDDPAPAPSDTAGTAGVDEGREEPGDHHDHGTAHEIAEGVPVPTVAIDIAEDPVEGWNLRIRTTDFEIVPENVSTTHIDGQGHMHLYIDGEKVSRLYGDWHHIGPLMPGEHEIRVELSSNDHSALATGGDIIDATATVVAAEMGEGAMGHDHAEAREAREPHPSVAAALVDDPAGGWNLHTVLSNFRLAPEHVSGEHVDGEGHMHLSINGEKVARIYEEWHQMPPLPAGTHDITVALQTNDHAPVTVGGVAMAASITLEVSAIEATLQTGHDHHDGTGTGTGTGSTHDHDHDHDHGSAGEPTRYDADVADAVETITVDAVGGAPVGGVQRVEVDAGSVVALMVRSDIAEEVHVHGYDILRAVSDGHPAHFGFAAEIPGVFEVEFENSGRLLLLLEIS